MAKLTKEEVDYSRGMIHSHCGKVFANDSGHCKHFQGSGAVNTKGRCAIVDGAIDPLYWCKEWE